MVEGEWIIILIHGACVNKIQVNAVYPSITQEDLIRLSVDQIIAHDRSKQHTHSPSPVFNGGLDIANILGTTTKVSAKDSRTFAKEIAKYIDSKDQKRGKKDKKDKEKTKEQEKSLMAVVRAVTAQHPRNRDQPNTSSQIDEPALWPLIRQVNVRCRAAALSTGAVLVDLPGKHFLSLPVSLFVINAFRCG